jgi:nucleotide-binding universal stress UspA family protein
MVTLTEQVDPWCSSDYGEWKDNPSKAFGAATRDSKMPALGVRPNTMPQITNAREKILDIAVRAVLAKGFGATPIDEAALEAGCPRELLHLLREDSTRSCSEIVALGFLVGPDWYFRHLGCMISIVTRFLVQCTTYATRREKIMYKKLIVPVDMEHIDKLQKSLDTAANLAKYYDSEACYAGISSAVPSGIAHNPDEFRQKLESFAQQQSDKYGHRTSAKAIVSHDPSVDMDERLLEAIEATGADLVVMASHIPGMADHFWGSHGGTIASRASISVFLVR